MGSIELRCPKLPSRQNRQTKRLTKTFEGPSTTTEEETMLTEPTTDKLAAMKLGTMADAWRQQQKNADVVKLGFDERFGLLVDAEWMDRENKRLVRGLRSAKLKLSQACLENIDYSARRELDRTVI